ncbi:MAG: NAD(P)H-dependent glycerol-3-phosphate dehydrogenase [Cytophagia bacterium]|nr:MAG: NAD(P)H-dependent glycerol-3-phosphate dehydrogenase [Runella sp.]TAG20958.1 MAG: NAD(P)H-dependent glycerol-3-phosphate dehydrogenase [Cytophagales bacterium]TAG40115.1 MAG: NAD(P)H-dependent glycerol-3-phosphate dehydrogenase [Cytophagia bacterium]TAG81755.1 MAG: NAD(P)H-dependent glycerol-3-phosphate dehydrogenase [Cytophagales bacterium]
MNTLKVGIIGGGSWGTTVAAITARNSPAVLWARDAHTVNEINTHHRNEKYLPGAKLPDSLRATTSVAEAVQNADVVVMGVPSQCFRSVLQDVKPFIRPWVPIVSLTKGIEQGTMMRMTQIIENVMPGHPTGILTGPNLAREIMAGQAAASVIAMIDSNVATALQGIFRSGLFRVYTNDDVIGCEIAGALKNVIAIAVGMGDGMGAGDNTRAALITRGLAELTRLGVAMGGKYPTFAGLAGMGDLIATCTSPLSRNRHVGVQLGKGRSIDEIIKEMSMVAEGVKTSGVVLELAKTYGVEMPITQEVYCVITGQKTPSEAFKGLLRVKTRAESDPG